LCCLFDSAYFSDVHLLFYISPMLSSLWLFFVIQTLIQAAWYRKHLFLCHLVANLTSYIFS
jgi:hypothetical protein